MQRIHVHGTAYRDDVGEYEVTLTVWAESDEEAMAKALRLWPELDVDKITDAEPREA